MQPDEFRRSHPDLFFLDPNDLPRLQEYLMSRGVIHRDEPVISAARAGNGNMNCTVRVTTATRTMVLKQSRPWVERYPQFEAPWDRALREMEFYHLIAPHAEIARRMPRLLDADPDARTLVLEDLGTHGDYTDVYQGHTFPIGDIAALATFLSGLHAAFEAASPPFPLALANRDMRELNHAHIFVIPFQPENGLDLDRICPGLAKAARAIRNDSALRRTSATLGRDSYLADGPCLLHGDFFPGSLVRTPDGPRVLDPEFGFFGRPEFDVAVFTAHLLLSCQPPGSIPLFLRRYLPCRDFDPRSTRQLAGIEIFRRILGYAQLPLPPGLALREDLLEIAHELVFRPEGSVASRLFDPVQTPSLP